MTQAAYKEDTLDLRDIFDSKVFLEFKWEENLPTENVWEENTGKDIFFPLLVMPKTCWFSGRDTLEEMVWAS